MKTTLPLLASAALVVIVPAWLLSVPASAQQAGAQERGEVRGGGGGAPAPPSGPAPSGGSSAPATGGGSSSQRPGDGSAGSGYSGARGESDGPHRGGATGGTGGYSVPRGGTERGSGARATGGGSGATSGEGGSGAGVSSVPMQGAGGRQGTGRALPRDGSGTAAGGAGGAGGALSDRGNGDGVPPYARPHEGHTPIGTAVPRGSVPPAPTGGVGVFVPGGYYGGYGYYDPWGYRLTGYGGGYGGYSGDCLGYYDPWYGGYPTSPQSTYSSSDQGSLKVKIKPREAEVYVDGYLVGIVDDFDGIFQRLHIESGPHRIEVRAQGYEPLAFDVRITPEHTTTYRGELKRIR